MYITLPKVGLVKFRDDLTQEQFQQQLQGIAAKYQFDLPKTDYGYLGSFTKGVSRGATRMGSMLGDVLPAIGASALGFDDYAKSQMAEATATEEKLARENPAQFESYKQVGGVGEGVKYALETLGETTPDILGAIASGGVGSAVAKRGAAAAGEKLLASELAAGATEAQASKAVAEQAAKRATTGQGIGVYLGSYSMTAPEVFQSIYSDSNQLAPGASLLFGSVSAALDSVLPATVLRSMSPAMKAKVTEKVLQQSGMRPGLAKNVTVGALKGIGTEALTESTQEAINIAAEGFVNENRDMWTSKDFNRIVESGVRGAIAGGAFGSVSGVGKNAQEKSAQQELQQQEEAARLAEEQRVAAIEQQKQQALALEQEQAARKSQANLPLPLPGIEEAVGPTAPMMGEETQAAQEAAPVEQVPAGQGDLFTLKGAPSPAALASVKAAEEAQTQATVEQARQEKLTQANEKLATPEGTKEVLGTLNTPNSYFEGYSKADQNRIRVQLQRRLDAFKSKNEELQAQRQKELEATFKTIEPTPATELTAEKLSTAGFSKQNQEKLKGLDLTKKEDYDMLAKIANGNSKDAVVASNLLENIEEPVVEQVEQKDTTSTDGMNTDVDTEITEPVLVSKKEKAKVAKEAKQAALAEPMNEAWDAFDTGIAFEEMPAEQQEYASQLHESNALNQEQADLVASLAKANKVKEKTIAPTVDEATVVEEAPVKRKRRAKKEVIADLGAALSNIVQPKANFIPETSPDLLKVLTELIDIYIQEGIESLQAVTARLRTDLGENNFRRVNKKDIARVYNEKKPQAKKEKAAQAASAPAQQASEISIVDTVLDSLPIPKSAVLNDAANALSNVPDGLRKGAFGFLSLPNMVELFGKNFPTLKDLLTSVEKRGARSIEYRDEVSKIVREGSKLIKSLSPEMVKKFNNITLELTRLKLDPLSEKDKNHPVVKQFYALPEPVYSYALKLAGKYKEYGDKYLELVINAIPQKSGREYLTLVEKMKAQFESNRIPFYLPLQRSGEYWVSFQDANGERVVFARESKREIEQLVNAIAQAGGKDIQQYTKMSQITHRTAPPTGFMAEVVRDLNLAGVEDSVINGIYQSYLSLFPAESLKQQFKPREGVLGYDNDVVQGFANIGSRMAHQLANMEYSTDIGNSIKGVREVYEANPTMYNRDIMENVTAQEQFLANPVAAPWASRASYFSYVSFITGNISSAVVNLTQLPIVVYSLLGGKYGYGEAFSAMTKAGKMYFAGGKDNNSEFMPDWTFGVNAKGRYAELYKQAVDRSALRRGVGYDLTEMGKSRTEDYTGTKAKIEHGLGFMFQNSERFNREVTLIAAFDLAYNKGIKEGKAEAVAVQDAIDEAIKVNTDAHSHALSDAGPRWFQNNLGKVMFTFKRFAQAQIYLTSRLAYQAFKGESPEVRKVARRQLTGIFGMAYLFAGAQGMPLYGGINLLVSALNAALGDDDEPFDFDEEIREAIGDMGYKGPINQLLNADIASRTGFNGMVWRDDPRRLAEVGPLAYAVERFAGPAYSVFIVNPTRAYDQFKKGQVERSIETMMPSFVRNGMKGMRYASEGALNSKGDPIVEDINAYNAAMQILGFTPADLSEAYARAGAMKQAEKFIQDRRSALLDTAYLAKSNGDFEGYMDVKEKIADFNMAHPEPGIAIKQSTLNRSEKARENATKDSVDGVHLNPKMKQYLIENHGS